MIYDVGQKDTTTAAVVLGTPTKAKTEFEGGRHENRVNKIALAAC